MLDLHVADLGARALRVVASDRSDGDVHPHRVDPAELYRRQMRVAGRRWAMLDQVHGREVVDAVARPIGGATTCGTGDVMVATDHGTRVAMWAADCAVVVLAAATGRLVGIHAGWRGLAAGVIDAGVGALDGDVVASVLGPVIGPCCYEFDADDLDLVGAGVGAERSVISASSARGALALDVTAAVRVALARHGIELDVAGPCTGCDERWFSHRVRRDVGRHAVVAWTEDLRSAAMEER